MTPADTVAVAGVSAAADVALLGAGSDGGSESGAKAMDADVVGVTVGDGDGIVRDSVAAVAEATDPSTRDPFVELGLVNSDRWVAPGGWRRAVVGVAVGVLAGWLVISAHHGDVRTGEVGP